MIIQVYPFSMVLFMDVKKIFHSVKDGPEAEKPLTREAFCGTETIPSCAGCAEHPAVLRKALRSADHSPPDASCAALCRRPPAWCRSMPRRR